MQIPVLKPKDPAIARCRVEDLAVRKAAHERLAEEGLRADAPGRGLAG